MGRKRCEGRLRGTHGESGACRSDKSPLLARREAPAVSSKGRGHHRFALFGAPSPSCLAHAVRRESSPCSETETMNENFRLDDRIAGRAKYRISKPIVALWPRVGAIMNQSMRCSVSLRAGLVLLVSQRRHAATDLGPNARPGEGHAQHSGLFPDAAAADQFRAAVSIGGWTLAAVRPVGAALEGAAAVASGGARIAKREWRRGDSTAIAQPTMDAGTQG